MLFPFLVVKDYPPMFFRNFPPLQDASNSVPASWQAKVETFRLWPSHDTLAPLIEQIDFCLAAGRSALSIRLLSTTAREFPLYAWLLNYDQHATYQRLLTTIQQAQPTTRLTARESSALLHMQAAESLWTIPDHYALYPLWCAVAVPPALGRTTTYGWTPATLQDAIGPALGAYRLSADLAGRSADVRQQLRDLHALIDLNILLATPISCEQAGHWLEQGLVSAAAHHDSSETYIFAYQQACLYAARGQYLAAHITLTGLLGQGLPPPLAERVWQLCGYLYEVAGEYRTALICYLRALPVALLPQTIMQLPVSTNGLQALLEPTELTRLLPMAVAAAGDPTWHPSPLEPAPGTASPNLN